MNWGYQMISLSTAEVKRACHTEFAQHCTGGIIIYYEQSTILLILAALCHCGNPSSLPKWPYTEVNQQRMVSIAIGASRDEPLFSISQGAGERGAIPALACSQSCLKPGHRLVDLESTEEMILSIMRPYTQVTR